MAEATTEKSSLVDWLGKLAALAASASLVASLAYDWGFFYTIKLSFSDLPTSLSDHARSALNWAPKVVGGFAAYLVIELLTRRIEGGKSEAEIVASSPNPTLFKRLRDSPRYLGIFIAVASLISYVLFGDLFLDGFRFFAIVAWVFFIVWVMKHPRLGARFSDSAKLVVYSVPAVVIFFWLTGRMDAIRLYEAPAATDVVYTGNPALASHVSIIRYFDKGLLVKESNGGIVFHQWSSIDRIEPDSRLKLNRGLVCAWFDKACIDGSAIDTGNGSARVPGK